MDMNWTESGAERGAEGGAGSSSDPLLDIVFHRLPIPVKVAFQDKLCEQPLTELQKLAARLEIQPPELQVQTTCSLLVAFDKHCLHHLKVLRIACWNTDCTDISCFS